MKRPSLRAAAAAMVSPPLLLEASLQLEGEEQVRELALLVAVLGAVLLRGVDVVEVDVWGVAELLLACPAEEVHVGPATAFGACDDES